MISVERKVREIALDRISRFIKIYVNKFINSFVIKRSNKTVEINLKITVKDIKIKYFKYTWFYDEFEVCTIIDENYQTNRNFETEKNISNSLIDRTQLSEININFSSNGILDDINYEEKICGIGARLILISFVFEGIGKIVMRRRTEEL